MIVENDLLFYHGSAVGWLMGVGFAHQKIAFGEADTPHPFLYVCSNYSGAASSAHQSKGWCDRRIDLGRIDPAEFSQNSNGIPEAVVYTFNVKGLKEIDLSNPNINREDAKMLFRGLLCIHMKKLHILEYIVRLLGCLFFKKEFQLRTWVEFAAEHYLKGPFDDRRATILKASGFQVVRHFEPSPDSEYGEAAALLFGAKPIIPANCTLL